VVVVVHIALQHCPQLVFVEDEQSVGGFSSDGADEPFGVGVGSRTPWWSSVRRRGRRRQAGRTGHLAAVTGARAVDRGVGSTRPRGWLRGFSFDVGAATLVDFESGGVGAELLVTVGMAT